MDCADGVFRLFFDLFRVSFLRSGKICWEPVLRLFIICYPPAIGTASDSAISYPPTTGAMLSSIICQMYEIRLFQALFVTVLFCMILSTHIYAQFHVFLCINMHQVTRFAPFTSPIRTLPTPELPADFCHLQTAAFCSKKHTVNCYQIGLKRPKNIHLPISKRHPPKKRSCIFKHAQKP